MITEKQKMMTGRLYRDSDPELVAERRRAQALVDELNATHSAAVITIGDNSVIGAGSVVTRDIPPRVLAVGNPCRVIREL